MGLPEPEESVGTHAVGHLGIGMVPKGHWGRMGYPLWSFRNEELKNCVKICRTGRVTDTSSIGISLR